MIKHFFCRALTWHKEKAVPHETTMCHTTCICASMCECACVRTYVLVCVRLGRKHPVKDFCYLLIHVLLIYVRIHLDFCYVGLFLCVQVMWRCMELLIAQFNQNRQSSLK